MPATPEAKAARRATAGIFIISRVFHPDGQAASVLLSQLAAGLASRGEVVTIYTGLPATVTIPCSRRVVWRGVRVVRGGLRIDGKKGYWRRFLAYAAYSLWLTGRLLLSTPVGARLMVVTDPPFAPVLVWLCSRFRGWTYDVYLHDVYPDGLVALGRMSPRGWLTQCWSWANRRALAQARHVLVLGRDMTELCQQNYGVAAEKIHVVPGWSVVNFPERMAAEETNLWKQVGRPERFLVQYSGNMGLWHDMDAIIDAAAQLRGDPDIHFLLSGDGRRRAEAQARARDLRLTNITWRPFCPPKELADSLQCCHAAIVSQRAGLEGVAVPSKLYGILASGRAVLAAVPENSEAARVVAERECGLVISPGNGELLANAIQRLKADRGLSVRMGENATKACKQEYTLERAMDRFAAGESRD